ncbi:MAG TPA: alanine--tRNA ligase [Candidatus Marinimicrobia bacterium]|nr:alanine--tRNA ligase [Candidatus Neomarinimicrobiota bacterium]
MKSSEIRQSFIDFFKKQHQHSFVPSSSVVPQNDPTLLFTNAGMNQFKPFFLGNESVPYKRVVNSQKCIRVSGKHNDLEEVGQDDYHHTFFEMLGNWSFGDYYKAEAIEWAWQLLTKEWSLDPRRLYATVYNDDEEAEKLWKKISGLSSSRILRFGEKDNFWEMGDTGPCGPCSEIHYYKGNDMASQDPGMVNTGSSLYIELWNLVFIQYNRNENGKLHPLPHKHVDTGAGFERIAAVLNNVQSNYETDVFLPLIEKIAHISGFEYQSDGAGTPHRVIADHLRMLAFAIADGALPGNEGRGYVLRRILRRAARFGRKIGLNQPFLAQLMPVLSAEMGGMFPELPTHSSHIQRVLTAEEESFGQTLDRGLEIFENIAAKTLSKSEKYVPDEDIFRLYDTFGFPLDLTRLLAQEKGLAIREAEFEKLMAKQREQARAAGKFRQEGQQELEWHQMSYSDSSHFIGYTALSTKSDLVRWAYSGEKCYLVFASTPFYAEAGGQVGDKGEIKKEGRRFIVSNTLRMDGQNVHIVDELIPIELLQGEFELLVHDSARRSTQRNHTATHLLHAALRSVLGAHVHQAGSYLGPDYLRFDYTHYQKLSEEDLSELQRLVNEKIIENLALSVTEKDFQEALDGGAMALFGEKYGKKVRTVKVGDFSYELCGGTHVNATGEIGYFEIIAESSIASGIRRIEAITGTEAIKRMMWQSKTIKELSVSLQVTAAELPQKIQSLQDKLRLAEKDLSQARQKLLLSSVDDILKEPRKLSHKDLFVNRLDVESMEQLKILGDRVRDKMRSGVAVFGAVIGNTPQILCVVSDDLVKQGVHAGKWVGLIGKALGGGGGGRPHMATAGGKKAELLDEVLNNLENILS